MIETVEKLTEIIQLEAKIIDDMFLLLLQHISTEDAGMIDVIEKIEDAAEMQHEIEADPLEDEGLPF